MMNFKVKELAIASLWFLGASCLLFYPQPHIGHIPLHKYDSMGHLLLFFIGTLIINKITGSTKSIIFMGILAVGEEIAQQLLTTHRHFSTKDLIMNFIGIGMAIVFPKLHAIYKNFKSQVIPNLLSFRFYRE